MTELGVAELPATVPKSCSQGGEQVACPSSPRGCWQQRLSGVAFVVPLRPPRVGE